MIEDVERNANTEVTEGEKKKIYQCGIISLLMSKNLFLHHYSAHFIFDKVRQKNESVVSNRNTKSFKMLSNKPCHRHTEALRHQQSTHNQPASPFTSDL